MTPPDGIGSPGPAEASSGDEHALIERCLAGDASAFEPLVERYRQRVWRLAYQLLHDREEAWDCAQEAFVRAFHSLSSFRGHSAFYTWLFRITVNVATDRQRSRGAQARAFGAERLSEEEWKRTMPDPGARPDQAAVQAEQRERIQQSLDALPPKARTIIMLSDIEGLSYREIADVLGCPIGTVMSRLHNARKRLKALLGPMLALVLLLGGCLLGNVTAAYAQPIIRFGVRVLQASNSTNPETPTAPFPLPDRRPPSGVAPPPPPSGVPPTPPGAVPDPRLDRILPQLRTIFRYSDYTTLERHRAEGPLGMAQRFSIPGERLLEVLPYEMQGPRVKMRVRLIRGGRPEMNANIIAAPGAPAVLGGPIHGNGVLIIILWANPNPPPGP
ncbi:MAG TPA: sigma-70 family RNA polymerase sigma factor [Candidatus Methylomirabilis sp.]|nr:sigma-70 family RNA polymerase sigma factor [Candidatus Methylomirabilis sp.]